MGGKARAPRRDSSWNPPSTGGDVTALFAMLVAVPLLLPLLSGLRPPLFAVPALALAAAAPRCLAAAARSPHPWMWRAYAAGAASASAASAVAAASLLDERLTTVAFYLGSGASVCLLAGLVPLLRRNLLQSRLERVVDALIFDAVVVSLGVWFIGLPGFSGGDPILTAVFMIDLAALALAAVPTLAATAPGDRRTGWWLVAVCTSACIGDGVVAQGGPAAVTAMCWGAAGLALVAAAADRSNMQERAEHGAFVVARIVLPLLGVLAFPVAATVLSAQQ